MKIDDATRAQIVRALKDKSTIQVATDFGLKEAIKNKNTVVGKVRQVYDQVRKNPTRFGLTEDEISEIQSAVQSRLPKNAKVVNDARLATIDPPNANLVPKSEDLSDFKELALTGRNKAYRLLMKKMDRVGRNNASIDEVNLSTLATTFGILFDKAQISKGEATENVAIMAKVNPNMSPEEALAMVLQMREVNQIDKEVKAKK